MWLLYKNLIRSKAYKPPSWARTGMWLKRHAGQKT